MNALDRSYGYCADCHSSSYDAGTITLDIVEAKTKRWCGAAGRKVASSGSTTSR